VKNTIPKRIRTYILEKAPRWAGFRESFDVRPLPIRGEFGVSATIAVQDLQPTTKPVNQRTTLLGFEDFDLRQSGCWIITCARAGTKPGRAFLRGQTQRVTNRWQLGPGHK
jgi:hypothetical protein